MGNVYDSVNDNGNDHDNANDGDNAYDYEYDDNYDNVNGNDSVNDNCDGNHGHQPNDTDEENLKDIPCILHLSNPAYSQPSRDRS